MKWILMLWAVLSLAACEGKKSECRSGEWTCSDDGALLTLCQDGQFQTVACLADRGQLCEAGACVDPWQYGSPTWSRCENEPLATPESLHDKMISYEEIARRLHIHPQLKWICRVELPCQGSDCSVPAVPESQATWQDVERWDSGENDGLWNGLFLAAEAFRYGTTREPEALDTIRLLLAGEEDRMAITGVPGVFTRQLIPPGISGLACPTDPKVYIPSVDKTDNQWVRVGPDGCIQVVDRDTLAWTTTSHCGLDRFAGWCWLDNVSQDEYAGHMFALGALFKLVDDPGVQTSVRGLLQQIGTMLVNTKLEIQDWDGRSVEHGRLYAMSLTEFPGFSAAMALDFIKLSSVATGDPVIQDFYDNCLLQKKGQVDCIQRPTEQPRPYTDYLPEPGMYVGQDSCLSNWNNISMHFASLHNLIWFEHDLKIRGIYQNHLQAEVFEPPDHPPRMISGQNNTWFDFIFAAQKALGPGSDGPALEAVENGICMLRQFPASKHTPTLQCPVGKCDPVCQDRLNSPIGSYARQVAERCQGTFLWWANPYDLDNCTENLRLIDPPTDYLLAYWMGRYYGFIDEGM